MENKEEAEEELKRKINTRIKELSKLIHTLDELEEEEQEEPKKVKKKPILIRSIR